jgi:hypothetical protein
MVHAACRDFKYHHLLEQWYLLPQATAQASELVLACYETWYVPACIIVPLVCTRSRVQSQMVACCGWCVCFTVVNVLALTVQELDKVQMHVTAIYSDRR